MNQAQALYRLQTIDLAIAGHQKRLQIISAELGTNDEVTAAERDFQAAQDALVPVKTRARDLELEIKSVGEKAAATENRLYSGTVSNPKELQDMQEEIASLKRRRAALEDDLLETMIDVETREAFLQETRQTLEQVRQDWAADQGDLVIEQQTLQETLAGLQQEREAALGDVDPASLEQYRAIAPRKQGRAVAELDDATCTICGYRQTSTTVQQLRQGNELVKCANCERILVIR